MWEKLQPKIVFAESVRQALLYAQKGDAEAAMVGRAIANVPEIRAVPIEATLHDPIIQALGVVSASTRVTDAKQFARFVLDQDGPSILKEFGFASPGEKLGAELGRNGGRRRSRAHLDFFGLR